MCVLEGEPTSIIRYNPQTMITAITTVSVVVCVSATVITSRQCLLIDIEVCENNIVKSKPFDGFNMLCYFIEISDELIER